MHLLTLLKMLNYSSYFNIDYVATTNENPEKVFSPAATQPQSPALPWTKEMHIPFLQTENSRISDSSGLNYSVYWPRVQGNFCPLKLMAYNSYQQTNPSNLNNLEIKFPVFKHRFALNMN